MRSRQFQKIFYDLYVAADAAVTAELRSRAALRVAGPDAHISHHTAAELWGLPIPPDSHTHVIYRREDLDDRGLRLIVVTSRSIYREPERTLERVRDALIAAGASGIRSPFANEWRRHFPVSA